MSPDRVGRPSSIASWINGIAGKSGSKNEAGKGRSVAAGTHALGPEPRRSLRADLVVLIEGVDLESEDAVRSLRRPVIRRILLNEFGGEFTGHPDLAAMVDRIESVLDADAAASAQFLRMLHDLRGAGAP